MLALATFVPGRLHATPDPGGYRYTPAPRVTAADRLATEYSVRLSLARSIYGAAEREGIPPALAFGVVRIESRFRPDAVSRAGAVGLMQVLPSTAAWIDPSVTRAALFEPATNLRVGMRYLRYLLDRYGGDTQLALLAYNRGPNRVTSILRAGGEPANGYARKVMASG